MTDISRYIASEYDEGGEPSDETPCARCGEPGRELWMHLETAGSRVVWSCNNCFTPLNEALIVEVGGRLYFRDAVDGRHK